jgi:hypothetical protein
VQSTGHICRIYNPGQNSGAEHRDINTANANREANIAEHCNLNIGLFGYATNIGVLCTFFDYG